MRRDRVAAFSHRSGSPQGLPVFWGGSGKGIAGGDTGETGRRAVACVGRGSSHAGALSRAGVYSNISCSFFFSVPLNRSVLSFCLSRLRPRRFAVISNRRPICQA